MRHNAVQYVNILGLYSVSYIFFGKILWTNHQCWFPVKFSCVLLCSHFHFLELFGIMPYASSSVLWYVFLHVLCVLQKLFSFPQAVLLSAISTCSFTLFSDLYPVFCAFIACPLHVFYLFPSTIVSKGILYFQHFLFLALLSDLTSFSIQFTMYNRSFFYMKG